MRKETNWTKIEVYFYSEVDCEWLLDCIYPLPLNQKTTISLLNKLEHIQTLGLTFRIDYH